MSARTAVAGDWRDAFRPLIRGLCGGFIFSIPIIYTMEMWWLGHTASSGQILVFVALSYLVAVGLNYVSGIRSSQDWREAFMDAIETLALGILVSAVMLVLLGVADRDSAWPVFVSQTMILAIPISIGASLSRSQLGEKNQDGDGDVDQADRDAARQRERGASHGSGGGLKNDLKDLALTAFGGVFLGFSVAPTEEILLIATQSHWWQSVGTVGLSLVITYLMLFEAQFVGQAKRHAAPGMFQGAWQETVLTYAVSLVISAYLLWFLGYLPQHTALDEALAMTVVLALPVSLGGAVARMIL